MDDIERRVTELCDLIQPGDLLTLWNGHQYPAASVPETSKRKNAFEKLVSVRMDIVIAGEDTFCFIPVNVWSIHQVERDSRILWSINGERTPIQLEMFG